MISATLCRHKKGWLIFMKKILIILALSFALISSASFAGSAEVKKADLEPHDKWVNLRVFMPGLFVGYVGGVWDIAVSKSITVGPILHVFLYGKYDGYDFGLNMNYAFSGDIFKNGFILNPYIEYFNANYRQPLNQFGVRPRSDTVLTGLNLLYQFIWDNGFNIMLGLGVQYADQKIPNMIGGGNFHGHYEVTFGYAF